MQRNRMPGQEIAIDLLLAGSDAFQHLAEEMAAAHDRWQAAGAEAATLEWARQLAAYAGWWCERLEAEADAVVAGADGVSRDEAQEGCRCRRRRRRC